MRQWPALTPSASYQSQNHDSFHHSTLGSKGCGPSSSGTTPNCVRSSMERPSRSVATTLAANGDGGVGDDERIALFRLGLQQDLVVFLPVRRQVGLAGKRDAGEARLVPRDLGDVAAEHVIDDRLAGDAVRA